MRSVPFRSAAQNPKAPRGKRHAVVGPALVALAIGLALTQAAVAVTHASAVRDLEQELNLRGQALVEETRSVLALELSALLRMAAFAVLNPPSDGEEFRTLAIGHGIPGHAVWYHDIAADDLDVAGPVQRTFGWPATAKPILHPGAFGGLDEALTRAATSRNVEYVGSDDQRARLAIVQPLQLRDRIGVTAFLIAVIDLEQVVSQTSVARTAHAPTWDITLLDGPPLGSSERLTRYEYLILDDVTWQVSLTPGEAHHVDQTSVWMVRLAGVTASSGLAGVVVLWSRRRDSDQKMQLLRDLNREKDLFLLKLAHEIRTPLAAVVGFLDILRTHRDLTPAERQEFLDHAGHEAEEITAAVHDVLVAARHELIFVAQPTDLGSQVRAVAQRHLQEKGSEKTLTLDIQDGTWAMADPLRVRQVVRNLLANAIRHGGSSVHIAAYPTDEKAVLIVADDGPGLPENLHALLEDPERPTSATDDQGLGLGLKVAVALTQRMDGALTYHRNDGRSIFQVQLPTPDTQQASAKVAAVDAGT